MSELEVVKGIVADGGSWAVACSLLWLATKLQQVGQVITDHETRLRALEQRWR